MHKMWKYKKVILVKDTDTGKETVRFSELFNSALRDRGLDGEVQVVRPADINVYDQGIVVKVMPGNITYSKVEEKDIDLIVRKSIKKEEAVKEIQIDPKDKQVRIVLRNCGNIDPENIDDYIAVDGYRALKKVLEENNFARFIIDNEEEDKINNLWDIAVGFMNNSLSVQEKIDILLMLNDEIDPNTKIVYDEQYIIVPDSLIEKRLIDEEIPKPTPAPTIKPIPKIPPTLRKRQNPYRVDISVIKKRLRPRDLFGARRIRSLGRGRYLIRKHTGLDLVSPIGTNLYAVSPGIVTEVYYYKKGQHSLWRNGKTLRYKTDSGLLITYLHLKEYNIKPGQRINLNTLLGKVGITGNADKSNPHVHIQVKKATVIDPYPYVVVDTE